jgi:Glycopeptide antibiotics resistance protein
MQGYLQIIQIGLSIVPFIILGCGSLFLLYSYHKFGSVSIKHSVIVVSFFVYIFMVYCFAVLPLPTMESVIASTRATTQFDPFYFVGLFLERTVFSWRDPTTYLAAMRTVYFYVPVLNILFLFPFGVYLRYNFERPFWQTILFTFLFSLFLELTQLSGLYGVYPKAYRVFDVDDLMMNTLGGVIGYAFTPLITWWLPEKSEIFAENYSRGGKVSYLRRGIALLIDWGIISTFILTFSFFIFALPLPNELLTVESGLGIIAYGIIIFCYFILLPYLWRGKTCGKWIVQIAIVENSGSDIKFSSLFFRQFLFYGIMFPTFMVMINFLQLGSDLQLLLQTGIYLLIPLLFIIVTIGFLANIIYTKWQGEPVLFYERLSQTRVVSLVDIK